MIETYTGRVGSGSSGQSNSCFLPVVWRGAVRTGEDWRRVFGPRVACVRCDAIGSVQEGKELYILPQGRSNQVAHESRSGPLQKKRALNRCREAEPGHERGRVFDPSVVYTMDVRLE